MYDDKDEVVQLYLDDIIPNRFQPREIFDERALKELAVSIKEHGVIQPIIVRNVNGKYEIIAGERRYKASALAGMTKIPAIIRDLDDKESSKVALLENLQRKNLNPIEEARTYQKILEIDQMTQEELAKTMGKSQSSVANKLRLLSLSDEIQDAILKEKISERHARALLNVNDTKVQKDLLDKVIETKMSVRALEEEIKELYPKGMDASDIPVVTDAVADATGFLNNSPLIPTAKEIEEEVSNYGKVVIAPPKEENSENNIIDFGAKENPQDEENPIGGPATDIAPSQTSIDINQIKENATDINQAAPGAAIDNLLNINPTPIIPFTENKEESMNKEITTSDDYFKLPDVQGIPPVSNVQQQTMPNITPIANSQPDTAEGKAEMAATKIKDLVNELKNSGVSINADEMNFSKAYQIIIKIDKI